MDARSFGVLIRKRRQELKMTQRELAMVTNVGERFIVELEQGKTTAQLGKALNVAECLGIFSNIIWEDKNKNM